MHLQLDIAAVLALPTSLLMILQDQLAASCWWVMMLPAIGLLVAETRQ